MPHFESSFGIYIKCLGTILTNELFLFFHKQMDGIGLESISKWGDFTSNLDIQILETDILVNKKTLVGNTFKQLNNWIIF